MFNKEEIRLIKLGLNSLKLECENDIERFGLNDESTAGALDAIAIIDSIQKKIR